MTRETKIGLLVGLAFIIVIGILLSDYKTASNEPVQAALQTTGNTVRSGVGSPTEDNVSPVAVVPPEMTPKQVVPTRDELSPKPIAVQPRVTIANDNPTGDVPIALAQEGEKGGEPIVAVGNKPATPVTDQPAHMAVRTYVAVDGDSLSKIAMKTMGAKNKAARMAIIALNKSLQANPNLIVVGHTYNVPAGATAAASAQPLPIETAEKPAVAVAQPQYTYTVKAGDSLWSIASDELGNSAAIPAIKAINKDILRGSDQVRVNMKLKLPAKPVAAAN